MPSARATALSWLVLLRRIPGYAPFLPLLWRSLFQSNSEINPTMGVPGDLTPAERAWLAGQVRHTPDGAVIVQTGPIEAGVTCALAAGCWASRRHVFALWSGSAEADRAFRYWHQTVIQQGFAPYVTPASEPTTFESRVDLLFGEEALGLRPRAVWIRRHVRAGSSAEVVSHCNTLTATRVPSNLKAPTQ